MLNNINSMLDFFQSTDEFVAATQYTAARFEFSSTLVEKDYLCSLVLMFLYNKEYMPLVFKGGTLLSKTYAGFNRLSEDLDFAIPMPRNSSRTQKSQKIKAIKNTLNKINEYLPIFSIQQPLTGHNNSCQYTMTLNYQSNITQVSDKILIDIGMRDELLLPVEKLSINTLLMDPFQNKNKIQPFAINGLHMQEAYAEKTRAALTRKELAIRDFYDLDYALKNNFIDFEDYSFIKLVKKKIEDETRFHDFTDPSVVRFLQGKIDAELIPTLRSNESNVFVVTQVIEALLKLKVILIG